MSSTPASRTAKGTSGADRQELRIIRPLAGPRPPRTVAPTRGSYIGRVGALAVALGVGAAVAALPTVAFADTAGSDGSSGASSGAGTKGLASPRSGGQAGERPGARSRFGPFGCE